MKSNYKRLGDIITPVSVKNTDMLTSDLRGVNYQKFFMKSVANIIGVDLSVYKVIKKGQFACNLMHVGRDECLPIALHRDEAPIIVSPAYFSFEVKNEDEILSEFLFLWFKRKEFDREACFYTDADVRQGLIKSSFYDIQVPVPPIEEQRKIVAEYQAIERRFENNRRLIAKLESVAQAIYRNLFIDNIDSNNLPQDWSMGKVSDLIEIKYGKDHKDLDNGTIPIYGSGGIMRMGNKNIYDGESVLIPRKGSLGNVMYVNEQFWTVDTMFYSIPRIPSSIKYTFQLIKSLNLANLDAGSAVPSMTTDFLNNYDCIIPAKDALNNYDNMVSPLYLLGNQKEKENKVLKLVQTHLLSKLSNL